MLTCTLLLVLTQPLLIEPSPPRYRMEVRAPFADVHSAFPAAFTSDGRIAGWAAPEPFHPQSIAVVTEEDALVELPAPFRSFNAALGANQQGSVVGISGLAPAIWIDGQPELLRSLPGYFGGAAWDINNSGLIVGTQTNDLLGFDFPIVWTSASGEAEALPTIDAPSGNALGVNDAGVIVGSLIVDGAMRPVRWLGKACVPTALPLPANAIGGEAQAVNHAGDVVGRCVYPNFTSQAMFYDAQSATTIELGTLGGVQSDARAINDQQMIVGVAATTNSVAGFVWTQGVMYDLNDLIVVTNEPTARIVLAADVDEAGNIAAEVVLGDGSDAPHRIAILVPCVLADFDCDSVVDARDLATLLGAWGSSTADLNGDGTTDAADLAELLGAWSADAGNNTPHGDLRIKARC